MTDPKTLESIGFADNPAVLKMAVGDASDIGVMGVLLSPENIVVNQHFSSDVDWLYHDLCERPSAKERLYKLYPQGFIVIRE